VQGRAGDVDGGRAACALKVLRAQAAPGSDCTI
jgi:hypothetical protein